MNDEITRRVVREDPGWQDSPSRCVPELLGSREARETFATVGRVGRHATVAMILRRLLVQAGGEVSRG